jgi:serine/threonine protein kinase
MPTQADDLRAELQAELGSAYTLEHELGVASGLRSEQSIEARAFVAREPTALRQVAIRVVPDAVAVHLDPTIFCREVELAASLRHPQLIAPLGAGTAGRFLYYVTPSVDGESLRQWLDASGGKLPVLEAVRIAVDVAGALQAAHEQGIVHRDVTPDNVVLARAHAVVTSAGVSRAVCRSLRQPNDASDRPAAGGWLLGTAAYMSPEQATGSTNLDGRSDIYSLGCVLYEMLTGARPFAGLHEETLPARRAVVPESVRRRRTEVPRSLDDVVMKALAAHPEGRYATAAEFQQALLDETARRRGWPFTRLSFILSLVRRAARTRRDP